MANKWVGHKDKKAGTLEMSGPFTGKMYKPRKMVNENSRKTKIPTNRNKIKA